MHYGNSESLYVEIIRTGSFCTLTILLAYNTSLVWIMLDILDSTNYSLHIIKFIITNAASTVKAPNLVNGHVSTSVASGRQVIRYHKTLRTRNSSSYHDQHTMSISFS